MGLDTTGSGNVSHSPNGLKSDVKQVLYHQVCICHIKSASATMSYKVPRKHRANGAFFRSTTAIGLAGLTSGFAVIAASVPSPHLDFKAALATIASAVVVALADWIVRRRQLARHEENVSSEHEKTRSLIRGKRKSRAKRMDGFGK